VTLCASTPRPVCLAAAQAQLQSNEKKPGKEKLQLQWKKIAPVTTRADFGDPVAGTTIVAACIYDDANALVGEAIVDRAAQTCGTKPCWKLTGKQGFQYQNKSANPDGVVKIKFGGNKANKGQTALQGKNDALKGLTQLPTGLFAGLHGSVAPTIQMVTTDGFCVGATMNKVGKDDAGQYKAQRK
jgi:hypothetical protein